MPNHEAIPGEPIEWRHTFRYAEELIEEGILDRDEVVYNISHFKEKDPEDAYDWLVTQACKRHVSRFEEDEDDIRVELFDEEEISITREIYQVLSTRKERMLKKLGTLSLRAIGATIIVGSTVSYLDQIDANKPRADYSVNLFVTHLLMCSAGALILRKSIKE